MKTNKEVIVERNEQIAHLWAHKTQDSARNSQNNFYFNGDTIYSYGSHFPVARHITNRKGVKAILFTTKTYSNTTASHISCVSGAIPDTIPVFCVSDVMKTPRVSMLDEVQERINGNALKASRAKSNKDFHLEAMQSDVEAFKALAEFIGSKRKPTLPDDKWFEDQKTIAKKQAKAQRERRAEQAKREEERRDKQKLEDRVTFENWLIGKAHHFPYSYRDKAYMRIVGDTIETSQGAIVPVEHVKRVAPLIVKLINTGETYQRNGHSIHIGEYVIESLDSNGNLKIGCHLFKKEELLRIAELIKDKKND